MKQYSAIIGIMFISVFYFDGILNISGRYHAKTLRNDVERVQTMNDETDQKAVEAAMRHFGDFTACVDTPANCVSNRKF
jgi:hypothetical protein